MNQKRHTSNSSKRKICTSTRPFETPHMADCLLMCGLTALSGSDVIVNTTVTKLTLRKNL